jgi:uncharacterized protein YecE (DUF72 family)
MPAAFVGTSGFASPSVRIPGRAASAQDMLAHYAELFNAVEMESTFTRFPGLETIRGWTRSAGTDLSFTVHMSRVATHVEHLADPATIASCLELLEPLGSQLACVVFAIPQGLECDVSRLRDVLSVIPSHVRTAWDFRDASWVRPDVADLLREHGAAPVVVETLDGVSGIELLPGGLLSPDWDAPFVYLRCRRERYHPHDVMAWGDVLRGMAESGRDIYVFFRQGPEAFAYATALQEVLS